MKLWFSTLILNDSLLFVALSLEKIMAVIFTILEGKTNIVFSSPLEFSSMLRRCIFVTTTTHSQFLNYLLFYAGTHSEISWTRGLVSNSLLKEINYMKILAKRKTIFFIRSSFWIKVDAEGGMGLNRLVPCWLRPCLYVSLDLEPYSTGKPANGISRCQHS